jgi:hypothetical protein
MSIGFWETLASINGDGTALTAAARASATQGASATMGRFTMPGNKMKVGDQIWARAHGRISAAVTTPGTARFDISIAGTANFDTLAMPLNIVVQTTVPWTLEVFGTVRAVGTTANIFWNGLWSSTASLNTAAVATGPWTGTITVPYNTAPVIGANFDSTVANLWDLQFTQTVATGSMTLHQYNLSYMTSTGF